MFAERKAVNIHCVGRVISKKKKEKSSNVPDATNGIIPHLTAAVVRQWQLMPALLL